MPLRSDSGWRPWGDHPMVVILVVITSLIAIFAFVTGKSNLMDLLKSREDIVHPNYDLPEGAQIIETLPIATDSHGDRILILWMVNPTKVEMKSDFYSCTDETRGNHYFGPTRVSLYNPQKNSITSTINIIDSLGLGADSFAVPYLVRSNYYAVSGQKDKNEQGKPTIMLLKDYNSDGQSYEFVLYNKSSCKSVDTTLVGYSEKQDKIINYPVNLTTLIDGQQQLASKNWVSYLFTSDHMRMPGYWNYEVDYRPTGGSLFQYEVRYDKDEEEFIGTLVISK